MRVPNSPEEKGALKDRPLSVIAQSRAADPKEIAAIVAKSKLHHTYVDLVNFFQTFASKRISRVEFIALSHAVYGWMPRMLLIIEENIDIQSIASEWENAPNVNCSSVSFFDATRKALNGSIVGLSKLLHFGYPEKYPIIDQHVFKALTGRKYVPLGFWTDHIFYRNYMILVSNWRKDPILAEIRDQTNALYQPISDIRFVELFLHSISKHPASSNSIL